MFERRLWHSKEADPSLLPIMKHLNHAVSADENQTKATPEQSTHDQVNNSSDCVN